MGKGKDETQHEKADFLPRARERTDDSAGGDFQPRARERTDEAAEAGPPLDHHGRQRQADHPAPTSGSPSQAPASEAEQPEAPEDSGD